ncbi:MAG: hypothetical protein U9Q82_03005 [Chloroflexota bacterium]|nr:hypothetical protein [Chloroflexota bacterium]
MNDKLKTTFALVSFTAALTLPLIGLGYGWWRWDISTGLIIMAGIFVFFFAAGALALARVHDLSWLATSLPFLFGSLYTVMPDVIPLQVDDAVTTTAGALLSYALALRKKPNTPKWIIIPLLAAGSYALLGGALPGPVDEIIVDVVALLVAGVGARKGSNDLR